MQITSVRYSPHFRRATQKLPLELRIEVRKRERWFRANCFDPRLKTHPLSGKLKGFWSFSITRKHRIMFEFLGRNEVAFVDIGDHDIYR